MDKTDAKIRKEPGSSAQATDMSGLSGFDGIEHHIMQDDETKMQGYSKDMDTLLVFAALYSAILTAFVVETYQMLQQPPSDVTNQLLAANNKILMDGFTALISPHSSITPTFSTASVPPFRPSSTARWINSLFFVSLVLSLSAAFLSIQIKQWIGEYMRWNLLLGMPSQNITIRQFRYEGWISWRVDAIISIVPALLGLAMVLFFIGVVILLWTLDHVVAICGTVAAATFLLIFAAFTVLPVFSRRCPYRTPMTWALLLTWKSISRPISFALHWARNTQLHRRWRYFWTSSQDCHIEFQGGKGTPSTTPRDEAQTPSSVAHLSSRLSHLTFSSHTFAMVVFHGASDSVIEDREEIEWASLPASWREHDLYSLRDIPVNFGGRALSTGDMRKLEQAIIQYRYPQDEDAWGNAKTLESLIPTSITPLERTQCQTPNKQEEKTRSRTRCASRPPGTFQLYKLRELLLLLRALGYVSTSSHNAHVNRYLTECMPSLLDGEINAQNDARRELLSRKEGQPFWVLNLEDLLAHEAAEDLVGPTVATWLPYLRQYILTRTSPLSGEHADVYRRAVKENRLTYKNGRLEVRRGRCRRSECEIILTDYFPDSVSCDVNALMLPGLLVTFARWIQRPLRRGALKATVDSIMRKVIKALESLLNQSSTNGAYEGTLIAGYSEGLGEIVASFSPKTRKDPQGKEDTLPLLSVCDSRLCRRLMHLLESLHQNDMIRHLSSEVDISVLLHDRLKAAHRDQICEVADCPWVIRCKDRGLHHEGCDLLHNTPVAYTPALSDSSLIPSSSSTIPHAAPSMLLSSIGHLRERMVDGSGSTLEKHTQGGFDLSPFSNASTLASSSNEADQEGLELNKVVSMVGDGGDCRERTA